MSFVSLIKRDLQGFGRTGPGGYRGLDSLAVIRENPGVDETKERLRGLGVWGFRV